MIPDPPTHSKLQYCEKIGNLFSGKGSYVHNISLDCGMGRGISMEFRKHFPKLKTFCKNRKGRRIGMIIEYPIGKDEYVLNLISKTSYKHDPTYDNMDTATRNLKTKCQALGIKQLNFPKIGCGLDHMEWCIVKRMITDIFANTDIHICVYFLPNDKDYNKH